MANENSFVISLGGSIVAPKEGFDIKFLKDLRSFVRRQVSKGRRMVIVVGGGATARQYVDAASGVTKVSDEQKDQIGIRATILNAALVQSILGDVAHDRIITDPRVKLKVKAPIVIAAGWKPGFSSDMDAVILAEGFGAKTVINLSNISHVYDSDPRKNPKAKPIDRMSWKEFISSFGTKWVPGLNAPFDPVAAKRASRTGKSVVVADGRNLGNLGRILDGKSFEGTLIS